jgi:hypothetical protein
VVAGQPKASRSSAWWRTSRSWAWGAPPSRRRTTRTPSSR